MTVTFLKLEYHDKIMSHWTGRGAPIMRNPEITSDPTDFLSITILTTDFSQKLLNVKH